MNYSEQDYQSDLKNPEMIHLDSRERFQSFYQQCSFGIAKDIKYVPERMNWIEFGPNARIIELGCCSGQNVVEWLTRYPDSTMMLVDVAQGFIDETRRRVEQAGLQDRASYHVGFIEDLPAGDVAENYTDVVLTETLEHVQDPLPVLEVAWSLVAPGGNLWITVPSFRIGTFSHVRGINATQLGEMLQEIGAEPPVVLKEVPDPSTRRATRCHVVRSQG